MSAGPKELVFNTQERAVSVDMNRMQRFAAYNLAEIFRYMVDVQTNDDLEAGARATETLGTSTPLRAEIVNGLMVRPQVGTQFFTIDPGVMFAISPDGSVDDSVMKMIKHETSSQAFLIGVNASGSTRIDVIECRVSGTPSEVSDSRDVFNPSTGLFTATSLVKERKLALEFRVRQGTPAAGFPGLVSGWLPLAVVSIPTGTTTCDTMTFWDVRPLLNDRELGPMANASTVPRTPIVNAMITPTNLGIDSGGILQGNATAFYKGRRLGGMLRRSSPGTDGNTVDFSEAVNCESGLSFGTAAIVYLYLLAPFGLPRWARYTDASTGSRVPRGPRGIVVLSKTGPNDITGVPSAGIVLHSSYGLGATPITDGVCIAATRIDDPGAGKTTIQTFMKNGWSFFGEFLPVTTIAPVFVNATTYRYTLTPGTHYPKNARRLKLFVRWFYSVGASSNVNGQITIFLYNGPSVGGISGAWVSHTIGTWLENPTGGAVSKGQSAEVDADTPVAYPSASGTWDIELSSGPNFQGPPDIFITGWEM